MSDDILMTSEDDKTRVRLVRDESADALYDDGGAPIWRVDYRGEWSAAQVTSITSHDASDRIAEAIERWWDQDSRDTLERYLRIFHGVTVTERWHSGSAWYFTCDPAQWREDNELTAENMAGFTDHQYSLMAEYKAWCDGDVYGWIVEEKATWQRVDDSGTPSRIVEPNQIQTWEEVESCYGFYGYDVAVEAAQEIFTAYTK